MTNLILEYFSVCQTLSENKVQKYDQRPKSVLEGLCFHKCHYNHTFYILACF